MLSLDPNFTTLCFIQERVLYGGQIKTDQKVAAIILEPGNCISANQDGWLKKIRRGDWKRRNYKQTTAIQELPTTNYYKATEFVNLWNMHRGSQCIGSTMEWLPTIVEVWYTPLGTGTVLDNMIYVDHIIWYQPCCQWISGNTYL